MTETETTTYSTSSRTKYLLVAVAVVLAFFAAYGIASGRSAGTATASGTGAGATAAGTGASAACGSAVGGTSACDGTCGGTSAAAVESTGSAAVEGDVQRISVDVSAGYFDPSVIRVKAGVPVEITFGEGSGCMAEVMFKDFSVFESLTDGGAVVNLPALDPGEYSFSCGMEMVYGTVIAE